MQPSKVYNVRQICISQFGKVKEGKSQYLHCKTNEGKTGEQVGGVGQVKEVV